jgi:hypothetical protein
MSVDLITQGYAMGTFYEFYEEESTAHITTSLDGSEYWSSIFAIHWATTHLGTHSLGHMSICGLQHSPWLTSKCDQKSGHKTQQSLLSGVFVARSIVRNPVP